VTCLAPVAWPDCGPMQWPLRKKLNACKSPDAIFWSIQEGVRPLLWRPSFAIRYQLTYSRHCNTRIIPYPATVAVLTDSSIEPLTIFTYQHPCVEQHSRARYQKYRLASCASKIFSLQVLSFTRSPTGIKIAVKSAQLSSNITYAKDGLSNTRAKICSCIVSNFSDFPYS
jgi:hypothetical protein